MLAFILSSPSYTSEAVVSYYPALLPFALFIVIFQPPLQWRILLAIDDQQMKKNKQFQFGCALLSCLFSLSSTPANATEKNTEVISGAAYLQAQQLVEVEPGRRLNLYCRGNGSPTVIFDSGLTDEISAWAHVQDTLSQHVRTCSYDRAGIGFSDGETVHGDSSSIVKDLHALLGKAGIQAPYVLVGHSYGGMNIRLFADRYLSEVAGMVFVDPAHEFQREGKRQLDPRQLSQAEWLEQTVLPSLKKRQECIELAKQGFVPGSAAYKQCGFDMDQRFDQKINEVHQQLYMKPAFQRAQLAEEAAIYTTSAEQVRREQIAYGNMPLIVLSAFSVPDKNLPVKERDLKYKNFNMLFKLHQEIASYSSQGVVRIVPDSGHNIHSDQPEAVSSAILDVINKVRALKNKPASVWPSIWLKIDLVLLQDIEHQLLPRPAWCPDFADSFIGQGRVFLAHHHTVQKHHGRCTHIDLAVY